jgi:hypothetical protein
MKHADGQAQLAHYASAANTMLKSVKLTSTYLALGFIIEFNNI